MATATSIREGMQVYYYCWWHGELCIWKQYWYTEACTGSGTDLLMSEKKNAAASPTCCHPDLSTTENLSGIIISQNNNQRQDRDNTHPWTCLTVWRGATVLEPRQKISACFSHYGYLSSGTADNVSIVGRMTPYFKQEWDRLSHLNFNNKYPKPWLSKCTPVLIFWYASQTSNPTLDSTERVCS